MAERAKLCRAAWRDLWLKAWLPSYNCGLQSMRCNVSSVCRLIDSVCLNPVSHAVQESRDLNIVLLIVHHSVCFAAHGCHLLSVCPFATLLLSRLLCVCMHDISYSDACLRLTHEQLRICNYNTSPGEVIKVVAFAGMFYHVVRWSAQVTALAEEHRCTFVI